MQVHELLFLANVRGAVGVMGYLQDHRKDLRELLLSLQAPVLLDAAGNSNKVRGMALENASLRAQREIWNALVQWQRKSSKCMQPLEQLAATYIELMQQRHEKDGGDRVSLELARILQHYCNERKQRQRNHDSHQDFQPCAPPIEEKLHVDQALMIRMQQLSYYAALEGMEPEHPPTDSSNQPPQEPENNSSSSTTPESSSPQPKKRKMEPQTTTLPVEIASQCDEIAKRIKNLTADDRTERDHMCKSAVAVLQSLMQSLEQPQSDLEACFALICERASIASGSDELLFHLSTALIATNWSTRYASLFLQHVLLVKIQATTSILSRVLVQCVLLFRANHVPALIESLLVPLLTSSALATTHSEAIIRILREIIKAASIETVDTFLSKAVYKSNANDARPSLLTHDPVILVVQNVLNLKATLSNTTVAQLIEAMELAVADPASSCLKSTKFATMVFTFVSKYPQEATRHLDALESIVKRLQTPMAKSTLRMLEKLGKS